MQSKKNIIYKLIVVVLFLLMIANAIFWSSKKAGFHLDESFTFNFISKTEKPSIANHTKFFGDWVDRSYFEDYMTISDDEAFDMKGVYQSIISDAHPPLYYMLIELTYSVLCRNRFSLWPGLILNVILLMGSVVVLYMLARKVLDSDIWALFVSCMYGFGIGSISIVVFFRMYMLFMFFGLLFCYANYMLMDNKINERQKGDFKYFVLLFLSSFLGFLTQYYFLIFAFILCCMVWLFFIVKRDWKNVLKYAGTMGFSLVSFYAFWPEVYNDLVVGTRGKGSFKDGISFERIKEATSFYFHCYDDLLFSRVTYYAIIVVLMLVFVKDIIRFVRNKGKLDILSAFRKTNTLFIIQLMVFNIIFSASIILVAPYITMRYLSSIVPFVFLVYFYLLKGLIQEMKNYRKICVVVFMIFSCITIYGLIYIRPQNLFEGEAAYQEVMKPYEGSDAIYIVDDHHRKPTAYFCPLALNHNRILPLLVNQDYEVDIKNAYDGKEATEPVVVYVYYSIADKKEARRNIRNSLGTGKLQYLSTVTGYHIYVYTPKIN